MNPLRWTREAPKEAGFYWIRSDEILSDLAPHNVSVACVIKENGGLVYLTATAWECGTPVSGQDAEWAGPIAPPEEKA